MLNDWKWNKIDDYEYRLMDSDQIMVGYVISDGSQWHCRFYNKRLDQYFGTTFSGMTNAEETLWQATIWIYDECNKIANSFHHIRDHLPELHDLRMDYERSIGETE